MELKIYPYGKNDTMCNCNNCEEGKCRLAVTVEDNFAPCTFPKKMFDVEIRSRDGCFETFGKVDAGGSQIFDLPCDATDGNKEYIVTVIGDTLSSPRAQTRRVCCCCGNTSGVTFIFMAYEPECEIVCPPCPPPCPPMPCIEIPPKPPTCPCEVFFM